METQRHKSFKQFKQWLYNKNQFAWLFIYVLIIKHILSCINQMYLSNSTQARPFGLTNKLITTVSPSVQKIIKWHIQMQSDRNWKNKQLRAKWNRNENKRVAWSPELCLTGLHGRLTSPFSSHLSLFGAILGWTNVAAVLCVQWVSGH